MSFLPSYPRPAPKNALELAPAEIWDMVCEEATTLAPFSDSAWLAAEHFDVGTYDTERALALSTQLSLPLICRDLHAIASKFLFVIIHIASSAQLFQLLARLENDSTPFQKWTEEIILCFNLSQRVAEVYSSSLLRLFRQLPRLRTVVDRTISLDSTPLRVAPLCMLSPETITSVLLDSQVVDIFNICQIFTHCKSLLKLAVGRVVLSNYEVTLYSASISTLHIRVNHPQDNCFTIPRLRLPNLQHVTILNGLSYGFPLICAEAFIVTHGQQLVSIDWRNPYGKIDISFLFNFSPHVKRVDYTIDETPVPRTHLPLPFLQTIGFHQTASAMAGGGGNFGLDQRIVHLNQHVTSLEQFSSLNRLFVLDQTAGSMLSGLAQNGVRGFRISSLWYRQVQSLALRGVRVLDRNGHVVRLPGGLVPLWMKDLVDDSAGVESRLVVRNHKVVKINAQTGESLSIRSRKGNMSLVPFYLLS